DCSGLGPHCGDGITNGPEPCDDGNMSTTDACLNTYVNATCGDGFVQAGVEECDEPGDTCGGGCRTVGSGEGAPAAALLLLALMAALGARRSGGRRPRRFISVFNAKPRTGSVARFAMDVTSGAAGV